MVLLKESVPYKNLKSYEGYLLISCFAMMAGFLFSRVLLSVGMIALLAGALWPSRIGAHWKQFNKSAFAWYALLFFLAYAVSGFWSNDLHNWRAIMQIKLPFAVLPFAMLYLPFRKPEIQQWLITGILLVMFSGMMYTGYFIIRDPGIIFSGKHLPSPVHGDYIRFTMALVLSLQLVFYLFFEKKTFCLSPVARYLLVAWSVIAVAYIHLQAAKSGLLCFYILLAVHMAPRVFKRHGVLKTVCLLAFMGIAFLAALQWVPPMKAQMKKLEREKRIWDAGDTARFETTSSVVPRLISYEAAWKGIKRYPLSGVGAGDLQQVMNKQYQTYFLFVEKRFRIVPHNQYVCTALMIGIPMTIFLILMVVSPLRKERRIYPVATAVIMLVGTMIEPMLEVQYGVFVYLFFTLLWMAFLDKRPIHRVSSPSLS